ISMKRKQTDAVQDVAPAEDLHAGDRWTTPSISATSFETGQVAITQSIEQSSLRTRTERDLLGEAGIPAEAHWGIHTLRAVENFPITGVSVGHFPEFVRALAMVKAAAARANKRLGQLSEEKCVAIE